MDVRRENGDKKIGLALTSVPLLGIKYYTIEKSRLNLGHVVCAGNHR